MASIMTIATSRISRTLHANASRSACKENVRRRVLIDGRGEHFDASEIGAGCLEAGRNLSSAASSSGAKNRLATESV